MDIANFTDLPNKEKITKKLHITKNKAGDIELTLPDF